MGGITAYLEATGQSAFMDDWKQGRAEGLSGAECLVSMFAKMCYRSLVLGKNTNVTSTRNIRANLESVIKSGHGSVWEHVSLNFITTDCSRVFTHELVRHRVGVAYSQTSGRYCAIDDHLDLVFPPDHLTDEIRELLEAHRRTTITTAKNLQDRLIPVGADFATKKMMTSMIRRIAPNGQTNEIAWSANLRALRHMIEMRTSHHAEWEIRLVFNQVADIVKERWPMLMFGSKVEVVDGLAEYTNLRI